MTDREEKVRALRELARLHPTGGVDHIYGYGLWKNPLNPKSTGRRWTPGDLDLFRMFQAEVQTEMRG